MKIDMINNKCYTLINNNDFRKLLVLVVLIIIIVYSYRKSLIISKNTIYDELYFIN